MHVASTLDGAALVVPPGAAVTFGNFDGVHRGHQAILARVRALADEGGLQAGVITFDPHPVAVLRPEARPQRLSTLADRLAAFERAGIDVVLVVPFDASVAAMSAEDFVDRVLVGRMGARHVVTGTDCRFGRGGTGDLRTLERLGAARGLVVHQVGPVCCEGARVSSSRLRELVAAGHVARAAAWMGRAYRMRGRVVPGDRRGRILGFPTANVVPEEGLVMPAPGVYRGRMGWDGLGHRCAINVGRRPTFGGGEVVVEAHVLDFDGDLYGRSVWLDFEARLRPERRFDTVEALAAQLARDVAAVRAAPSSDRAGG